LSSIVLICLLIPITCLKTRTLVISKIEISLPAFAELIIT